ncbi:hypothetical protein F5983_33070 [Streptomyces arboris]|uniref:Pyridoxine 5'-phosphate oxidase dimerisation C-terminal domain-containing protein n=1 Tax=Streptomyces arboris TaxID=2600619 RepID=A0A5N5ECN6_9ACTN|nr:hypothetical protein F5983_33070 [Streptomyces arboris]
MGEAVLDPTEVGFFQGDARRWHVRRRYRRKGATWTRELLWPYPAARLDARRCPHGPSRGPAASDRQEYCCFTCGKRPHAR